MSRRVTCYRDLIVWQKAMILLDVVDAIVRNFTAHERIWLGSQMQRAALSIVCNIAEGHSADYTGVYLRQISSAKGSTTELETQILVVERRRYAPEALTRQGLDLCDEIGRILFAISRKLRAKR